MKANTKKNSTTKKLVPAAGSLLISAAMLGTSTYAWFTMSREVEVTGLKMTATVPEDLQISVGKITAGTYLNNDDSYLVSGETAPTEDNMWSNTLNISHYYKFGRLIPASSTDGKNIFFTPDATAQGKDVKQTARYFAAATGLSGASSGTPYMAKLHPITAANDQWGAPSGAGYSGASTWSNTNDDGYYIDIPVWIRSSSDADINLTVKAYVKPDSNTKLYSGASIELYKATRVAILGATSANSGTNGLVDIKDGSGTGWTGSGSIINYYSTSGYNSHGSGTEYQAVKAAVNAGGSITGENTTAATNWGDIYGPAVIYDGTTSIATIPGSGNGAYGTPTMLWVRVWLEGEDPECWNQNAGQDWNISLKFEKK